MSQELYFLNMRSSKILRIFRFVGVFSISCSHVGISAAQEHGGVCEVKSPLGEAQITSSELLRDIEAQEQYLQRESESKAKQDRAAKLEKVKGDLIQIRESERLSGVYRCEMRHVNAKDYIGEIVVRIEDCAARNFPKVEGKSIYGNGVMKFTIDGWGNLVDSSIAKSSNNPLLDAHMTKLVEASAPFGDVPGQMLKGGYKMARITFDFDFYNSKSTKPPKKPKEQCKFKTAPG